MEPSRRQATAPVCSIILPLFNHLDRTQACLETLIANTPPDAYEVILVDNGSTDGTAEFLACLEGDVSVVRLARNLGFATACNQGASRAKGKYLVFLKSEVWLHHGWLEALLERAEADPGIGVLGSKLLGEDGAIRHAGFSVRHDEARLMPFSLHLGAPAAAPEVCRPGEVPMLAGACLMTRRDVFQRLGGFDETYFTDPAAMDYCLRARDAGYAVMYCPESGMTQMEAPAGDPFQEADFRDLDRLLERWHPMLAEDAARGATATARPPRSVPAPHVLFTMFGWTEDGGGTLLPRQIAKRLASRGFRVSVVYTPIRTLPDHSPYHLERSHDEGVDLFAVYNRPAVFYDTQNPGREVDDPEMRRLMAMLLDELRPDLVHYHSFATFSMGIAEEVERAGIPSLYTSHNYWPLCPRIYLISKDLVRCDGPSSDGRKCAACLGFPDQVDGYAHRLKQGQERIGRRVDRHLAVSRRVRELFVANGHDPERIHVLHQALDTVDALWATVGAVRPWGGDPTRPLRVGFFGSVVEHKGVHVLANALQRFDPTQLEAHVFGAGPSAYAQVLHQLDQRQMLTYHGHYEAAELPDLLRQVDLVVIPSIWDECGPLVAVEALAARCPVIGSRLGGLPDFVEDGLNGLLFEPGDAAGLANALGRFILHPELLETMQRAIRPPRGFEAYVDDLEGQYREVLAQRAFLPPARHGTPRSS